MLNSSKRERIQKNRMNPLRQSFRRSRAFTSDRSIAELNKEILDGESRIRTLLAETKLHSRKDLQLMGEPFIPKVDLEAFEKLPYGRAKKELQRFRKKYSKQMDRFLQVKKNNIYYKERMQKIQYQYEVELAKMEQSLAKRPEGEIEARKRYHKMKVKWALWEEEQKDPNRNALKRMRKVFRYKPNTSGSICHLLREMSPEEVISKGFEEALVDRVMNIPVLSFIVMSPKDIRKLHAYDFVNRYRFKNLQGGYVLDLIELRALYAVSYGLEANFNGENAWRREWRISLRNYLNDFIERQKRCELDIDLERNPVYWDKSKIDSIPKLLKLKISESEFLEIKSKLSEEDQETLDAMEEEIEDIMSLLDTSTEKQKLYKEKERIKRHSVRSNIQRDMLQARIEELDHQRRQQVKSKISNLAKSNPLYFDLLELFNSW